MKCSLNSKYNLNLSANKNKSAIASLFFSPPEDTLKILLNYLRKQNSPPPFKQNMISEINAGEQQLRVLCKHGKKKHSCCNCKWNAFVSDGNKLKAL